MMCDCIHPVVNTLVDLICPNLDSDKASFKSDKKNDDWDYRKRHPVIAHVVSPALAQNPQNLQSATPAGLNYRRHPNQHINRHYALDPVQRPLLADARLLYEPASAPNEREQPSDLEDNSTDPESLITPPPKTNISMPTMPESAPLSVVDVEIGAPYDQSYQYQQQASPILGYPVPGYPIEPAQHQLAPANSFPHPTQLATGLWGSPLSPPPNQDLHHALSLPQTTTLISTSSIAPPGSKHLEINFFELRLGQVIGEGGFGKVYYGEWRGLPVAVKVMGTDASSRTNVVQEFTREVHTMSTLPPHPNVLRLMAASTSPPNLALVMEYCSQGSLYALLHSPTTYLSWVQIVRICLAAAQGMAHLHTHHVLHRDLKSGNLLVTSGLEVKVADFGLSKVYQDLQTMTGGLGTYQWMAPEVLANQRYSEKADVYSFGIVMWECCARQVPYAGLNGMQAALAVMNRGLRPDIPLHTPEPLGALIRRCWAALPEQRPTFPEISETLQTMHTEVHRAESGVWVQ